MPVYVVVGAAGGIGSALCRRLAKNQAANLVLGGRRAEPLQSLANEVNGQALAGDATDPAYIDQLVEKARQLHGRLDGIVNCVGSILLKPAHLTTPDEFQQVLTTNLVTAFSCVRAGANSMRETGGSIVLLAPKPVSPCTRLAGLGNRMTSPEPSNFSSTPATPG